MSIRKVFLPIKGEMIDFYQVSTKGIKRYDFGGKIRNYVDYVKS